MSFHHKGMIPPRRPAKSCVLNFMKAPVPSQRLLHRIDEVALPLESDQGLTAADLKLSMRAN